MLKEDRKADKGHRKRGFKESTEPYGALNAPTTDIGGAVFISGHSLLLGACIF